VGSAGAAAFAARGAILDDSTLAWLRVHGVPDDVVRRLEGHKDRIFMSKQALMRILTRILAPQEFATYGATCMAADMKGR
jgi:hypothetical protein